MSLDLGELVAYMRVDKSDWDRGIGGGLRDIDDFGDDGRRRGETAGQKIGKGISSGMKSAVRVGMVGLAAGAIGALKLASDSVAEAREAAKVGQLTTAVIKSTGGAAKVTEKQVGALAGRLSEMAGVDDELVQSGANVLLTFTKIRNEAGQNNKIFDQATLAALNMSAALGQDLQSASIQVGKALNDPVKGVTALGRAGVQFTDEQKGMIKQLVRTGDMLGAQKMILNELDIQFKGAAKSQADEADKLAVAWGNFKEEIGTELMPVLDDLAVFLRKKGIPAAKDFFGWVKDDGIPMAKDFAGFAKDAAGEVKDLVGFLDDLPGPAKIAGITALLGGIAGAKMRGGNLGGGALGTAGKVLGLAKPVPVFVTNPGFGAGGVPGGGAPGKTGGLKGAAKTGARVLPGVAAAYAVGEVTGARDEYNGMDGITKDAVKMIEQVKRGGDAISDTERDWNRFRAAVATGTSEGRRKFDGLFGSMLKVDNLDPKLDVKDSALLNALQLTKMLNQQLDWIARPREARITIAKRYAAAGYQTLGGLQERAGGGPVAAGMPYLVGEREPELFVPNTSGRILNQRQMAAEGLTSGGDSGRIAPLMHGVTIQLRDMADVERYATKQARVRGGGGVVFR